MQVFSLSGKWFSHTETSLGEGSEEICMETDYRVRYENLTLGEHSQNFGLEGKLILIRTMKKKTG